MKDMQDSRPTSRADEVDTPLSLSRRRLLGGALGMPLTLVTRDLWHVFYQNQMQINGGKNDQFVAWADAGGLTMGYYVNTAYALRLWGLAEEFTLWKRWRTAPA